MEIIHSSRELRARADAERAVLIGPFHDRVEVAGELRNLADDLTLDIDEGTAAVSEVDRRVSLNEVLVERRAASDIQVHSALGTDHAYGDRALEIERVADRDGP